MTVLVLETGPCHLAPHDSTMEEVDIVHPPRLASRPACRRGTMAIHQWSISWYTWPSRLSEKMVGNTKRSTVGWSCYGRIISAFGYAILYIAYIALHLVAFDWQAAYTFLLYSCASPLSFVEGQSTVRTTYLHSFAVQNNIMATAASAALFSLQGQTALVTGGTRGIGQAVCIALAEAGADLILIQVLGISFFWIQIDACGLTRVFTQRNRDNLETQKAVEALGRKATIYTADLASKEEVAGITSTVLKDGHSIQILINCAGIQRRHPSHEFPNNDWNEVRLCLYGGW